MSEDLPLTKIVAACLDEMEAEGPAALDRACARHPGLATVIRQAVQLVESLIATGAAPPGVPHQFADRYRVGELLGHGGMGSVYRAHDTELDREVALKLVRSDLAGVAEVQERFKRELRAATRINHANLCPVLDGGVFEGTAYMAMELIEGETLHDRIQATTDPTDRVALLELLEPIGEALQALHDQGWLHRDVKPSNIMVRESGQPVLLDFGLARGLDERALTRVGAEPGTWAYMAPEQIAPSGRELDARADQHALGLVAYESLTGTRAFPAASEQELRHDVVHRAPPPATRSNPRARRDHDIVIQKALAKDRSDRYESIGEFVADLGRIRRCEPILARQSGPLLRSWRFCQRNPMLATLVAVIVLGVAISTTLSLIALDQQRQTQTALADYHFSLAKQYADTGEWQPALDAYANAEQFGYADTIEIRIGRVVAWESTDKLELAIQELKQLRAREDLGRHEAKILLLHGDINVNRLLEPTARVGDIERALGLGTLPLADQHYAEALLADTVDQSVRLLEAALKEKPSHRRAIELLGNLYLVSGRKDQARKLLVYRKARFPKDPTNTIYAAFLLAADGEEQTAESLYADASPAARPMLRVWVPVMQEAGRLVREIDELQVTDMTKVDAKTTTTVIRRIREFAMKTLPLLRNSRDHGRIFRVTPAIGKAMWKLGAAMAMLLVSGESGLRRYGADLEAAGETLGDGIFFVGAGFSYLSDQDFAAAKRALDRAVERTSLALRPSTIQLFHLELWWQQNRLARTTAHRATARVGVRRTLQRILEERGLAADVFAHCYLFAATFDLPGQAAEIAHRWIREHPGDPRARKKVGEADVWITRITNAALKRGK